MKEAPNLNKVYENDSGLPRFEGGQTKYLEGKKALPIFEKFLLAFPDTITRITKFPEGGSARVPIENISIDQLKEMMNSSAKMVMTGFRAGPHEEGVIRWVLSQIEHDTGTTKENLYIELTVPDSIENRKTIEDLALEKAKTPEKYLGKYEIDNEGFVYLGDIARGLLGMQSQYASRYLDDAFPALEYPNFGESLKLKNVFRNGKPTGNYYDYKIHKDDIETFVKRVKEYLER